MEWVKCPSWVGEVFLLTAGLTVGMRVRAVFGNRLWSVFNQTEAELVADMKVLSTHRMVRRSLVSFLFHRFCCDSCCLFGLKKKKAAALRLNFGTYRPSLPPPTPVRGSLI